MNQATKIIVGELKGVMSKGDEAILKRLVRKHGIADIVSHLSDILDDAGIEDIGTAEDEHAELIGDVVDKLEELECACVELAEEASGCSPCCDFAVGVEGANTVAEFDALGAYVCNDCRRAS